MNPLTPTEQTLVDALLYHYHLDKAESYRQGVRPQFSILTIRLHDAVGAIGARDLDSAGLGDLWKSMAAEMQKSPWAEQAAV